MTVYCENCGLLRSEVYWERAMAVLNGLGTKLLFDTVAVLVVIGALRIIGVL